MAKLIYSALASLDGYIEDPTGSFDWAMPDDEVHRFVNDLERSIGASLLGRRMYEVMSVWETDTSFTAGSPALQEYAAIWQAAEKIVYSRTLAAPFTTKTRIEREFDPAAVRALKTAAVRDISIGGPELAGHALRAGLVDEYHLFVAPVAVGGGKRSLPDGLRLDLTLLDEHRFANGMVYLRYRIA
jgi:dihydrofolate reductase